ncbi:unnamed protein product, partial [Schistosoma curassoni]|uniref:Tnp_DDE_dom domain-containing protein n=1 Tax=Schistosoma curassoni TaxID=6186 RepID=A0A183KSE7_9TREM
MWCNEEICRPAPLSLLDIDGAHIDRPIDTTPPTVEEIKMTIRQMKSRIAAGPDNIRTEALKSNIEWDELFVRELMTIRPIGNGIDDVTGIQCLTTLLPVTPSNIFRSR